MIRHRTAHLFGGLVALTLTLALTPAAQAAPATAGCASGIAVQVLGSGGPELTRDRASSAYLLWIDGRARAVVDFGGGAALRWGQSGADGGDLDAVFLSHLHIDHSADLPALVKAIWFSDRRRPLPIYGPDGNAAAPATSAFLRQLFGAQGAYRYFSGLIDPNTPGFHLVSHDVPAAVTEPAKPVQVFRNARFAATALPVHHGNMPALAWRLRVEGHTVVFAGDNDGRAPGLAAFARGADLLVMHAAIPQDSRDGVATRLHARPARLGKIAAAARVGRLVLSHRMRRTLGPGAAASLRAAVRRHFQGPLSLADDLDCYPISVNRP